MRLLKILLVGICVLLLSQTGKCDSTDFRKSVPESALILSHYLQIPSETGCEILAGEFMANICEQNGLYTYYFSREKNSYNFAASLYPLQSKKPNIVLLNHLDVVPPGDTSLWKYPPYSGAIEENSVWGRGAIDAKGLGIMQLCSILAMKRKGDLQNLPYNITLLCVSGEETGGITGAQIVCDQYLDILNPAVVLGEGGAGMKGVLPNKPKKELFAVSIAEKTNLWLKLELKIKTNGHGARWASKYPNRSMIKALSRLDQEKVRLKFNKASRLMFRHIGKAMGGFKGFFIRNINWTIFTPFVKNYIDGDAVYTSLVTNTIMVTNMYNPPGPPNIVSNVSTAVLDCRLLPGTNKKAFIRYLKRVMDEPALEIEVINESPQCEPTKPDYFFDVMETAILDLYPDAAVIPVLFPATTDNNYFREKEIPVYGFIPALLNNEMIEGVHNVNEKISIEALENGIKIYTNFLNKIVNFKPRQLLHLTQKEEPDTNDQ